MNTASVPSVPLLINGEFVQSRTSQWRDVVNPATQEVLARVPFATADEVDAAVAAAGSLQDLAQDTDRHARIFLKYQQLIRENEGLAANFTAEQGKICPTPKAMSSVA